MGASPLAQETAFFAWPGGRRFRASLASRLRPRPGRIQLAQAIPGLGVLPAVVRLVPHPGLLPFERALAAQFFFFQPVAGELGEEFVVEIGNAGGEVDVARPGVAVVAAFQLEALRQPIDAAIKADEQRREQERQARAAAEAQRVAAIRARITALSQTPMRVAGKSAEVIAAMLTVLSRLEIDATFAEFTQEAVELRAEVLTQIGEMHAATLLQEQEAARVKAESERLARVDHFGRKVHELRSLSIGMASKSVEAIQDGIDQLERMEVNDGAWGEFADQAKDALAAVLGELKVMRADAVERESIAALQAAEAQRLAVDRAAVERAAPVVVHMGTAAPHFQTKPLPAVVAPAAVPAAPPADDGKRIRLGDLCAEVGDGFSMTEAFVRSLGIEKAGTDKRAVLYTLAQRQEIFDALGTKLLGMSA